MKEEKTPPRSILGIPLRPLVLAAVLLFGLLVVNGPPDLLELWNNLDPTGPAEVPVQESATGEKQHIIATPEMIRKAAEKVQAEKLKELEVAGSAETILPTDRFFYVIELLNGENLEAVDVTIRPDTVIVVSAGGTTMTIARASVKKIDRFRLEEAAPAPQ